MFVSLNKKFLYTVVIFFSITALIFLYSFYITYGVRFQNELRASILRNQQYINLLYENNLMKKEFMKMGHPFPTTRTENNNNTISENLESTITREEKRILQLQKIYDDRYASVYEGIKIIAASSVLIILSLLLLWFLLKRWVLMPLQILTDVSKNVTSGDLTQRAIPYKQRYFLDETDFLIDTFNTMLDKIEKGVAEIQETENFLQKIIDGIPDGLCVIDQDYNIIISNKAYNKQVGSKEKPLKCYEAAQKRTLPCNTTTTNCPLNEIFHKNKKHIHVIQQFAHNPNRHLYINAAPLKIGEQTLIIEVLRDLSNDIKFSHQQKISSLGFMATSVAHEMKNHLGAIRIILERLLEDKNISAAEQEKLLGLVLQQIIESIEVPERLLKLSHFSEEDSQEINCYENAKDVVSLMDYEAKRHGMEIKLEGRTDLTIIGNENDFKMVLINLILNAIKAGKPNGEIVISFERNDKHNLIKVQDNGHGIAPHVLPHIFEPFYSEGKEGAIGSTGLGLAIVKSIMEKQKGKISVESQPGLGTCFSLQFPLINKK